MGCSTRVSAFRFRVSAAFFVGAFLAVISDAQTASTPGRFVDATAKLGIHFQHHASPTSRKYLLETMGSGVALFDYDNDGKLDIFFCNVAGIDKPGKGLGLAIADYDHDGWMDIILANDSIPEFLFHNRGNGTFEEVGLPSGAALDGNGTSFAGMGVDFEDYDNDGWPDLIITDLANQRYALYTNQKDGSFDYATQVTGVGAISLLHSGWGVRFFDYDNDGWKDLLIAQSHVMDTIQTNEPNLRYRDPPLLLHNQGGKRFADVSDVSGEMFHQEWAGRGLAIGDIDNDGRLDAVITSNNGPAWVLLNETSTANHWITLKLVGVKSNRDAIGARVRISTKARDQFATVTTSSSYESSSDKRVHFGLGSNSSVDEIEILWPSGIRQIVRDVKADQIITVTESTK